MGYVLRLLAFAALLFALVFWPALKHELGGVPGFESVRLADLAALAPSPVLHLVTRRCPVHGVTMHLDKVPIAYGLPVLDGGRAAAARVAFPYAGDPRLGGCIPGGRSRTVAWICPECQHAAERWRPDALRDVR